MRHRGKIEAVINNAQRAADWWSAKARSRRTSGVRAGPRAGAGAADRVHLGGVDGAVKDLRKQGWKFVGPTTVYAFMQAMGLINDHVEECVIRAQVAARRRDFTPPKSPPQRPAGCGLLRPENQYIELKSTKLCIATYSESLSHVLRLTPGPAHSTVDAQKALRAAYRASCRPKGGAMKAHTLMSLFS